MTQEYFNIDIQSEYVMKNLDEFFAILCNNSKIALKRMKKIWVEIESNNKWCIIDILYDKYEDIYEKADNESALMVIGISMNILNKMDIF
jgi:hypothetical protein